MEKNEEGAKRERRGLVPSADPSLYFLKLIIRVILSIKYGFDKAGLFMLTL
jgi:hypothetical protein